MSRLDSDEITSITMAFLVVVAIVCIMGAAVKGCQICENSIVEKERIRFNSDYEQVMVVGYDSPIWKKIVKDTCTINKKN